MKKCAGLNLKNSRLESLGFQANREDVNDKSLDKVKELETKSDTDFLTITYDLPSEARTFPSLSEDESDEKSSKLRNKRHKVQNRARLYGLMISQSVYVIDTSRVMDFIDCVEDTYEETDYKEDVRLKVIGKVYTSVLEELLDTYLGEITTKLRDKIEKIDVNLSSLDSDTSYRSIRKRLYSMKQELNVVDNRVEDMRKINKDRAAKYDERERKLNTKREGLIDRVNELM